MAKQPASILTTDENGKSAFIEEPQSELVRVRRTPYQVTEWGLVVIRQAIVLKQATQAHTSSLSDGEALVLICGEWNKAESARLAEKG